MAGEFVARAIWGARPPKTVTPIPGPVRGVAIHYEGPHMGAYTPADAVALVRGIQRFHMDTRGWADIAYTAVVDRFGRVFEGRGPGVRTAAQGTNDGNDHYYAVCYLAGVDDPLTDDARVGVRAAVGWLRVAGHAGDEIRPHSSFHSTACPGDELRAYCRTLTSLPPVPPPIPAPPPSPVPHRRRSQMFMVQHPNGVVDLCTLVAGNKVSHVGIEDPADRDRLVAAGVPLIEVSDATWKVWVG
jgi:hypothetical protein